MILPGTEGKPEEEVGCAEDVQVVIFKLGEGGRIGLPTEQNRSATHSQHPALRVFSAAVDAS